MSRYFLLSIVFIVAFACTDSKEGDMEIYVSARGIYGSDNDTIHWNHAPFSKTPVMLTFLVKNGRSDTCKLQFYQSFDSMNYDLIWRNRHAYVVLRLDTFQLLSRTYDNTYIVAPGDSTGFSLGINSIEIKSKYNSAIYKNYKDYMMDIVNNGNIYIIPLGNWDTIRVDNSIRKPIIYWQE